MKNTLLLILPIFFLSFLSPSKKQNREIEVCDSLITLYKVAIGYGNDINKATTIIFNGNLIDGSSEIYFSCYIKNLQDAEKLKVYYKLQSNEMTLEGGRNVKYWIKQDKRFSYVNDEDGFAQLKILMTFTVAGNNLINYKKNGFTASYIGEIDFNNSKAHKIRLSKNDYFVDFILDVKTNYLLMSETNNGVIIHYYNYKKISNSYIPHSYSLGPDYEIKYDTIILNNKISENKFIVPDK